MSTLYGPLHQIQREASHLRFPLPDLSTRTEPELLALAIEFQRRVLLIHSPACDEVAAAIADLPAPPSGTYDLKATTSLLTGANKQAFEAVSEWRTELYDGGFYSKIEESFRLAGWKSPTMRRRYAWLVFDALAFGGNVHSGALCYALSHGMPVQPVPEGNYSLPRGWFYSSQFKAHIRRLRPQYLQVAAQVLA